MSILFAVYTSNMLWEVMLLQLANYHVPGTTNTAFIHPSVKPLLKTSVQNPLFLWNLRKIINRYYIQNKQDVAHNQVFSCYLG